MARSKNELFVGREYLTTEGRTIKHIALIKEIASLNINKIKENPIDLVGLDLETNADTGELKLLGFYDGKQYCHYEDNFLRVLFSWIKSLERKNTHIAYWNRLDPAVLYKQFLLLFDRDIAYSSLKRFGKISGEWDRKKGIWTVKPVIEVKVGRYYYGIENAIRSSIKFFYRKEGSKFINTVWAYDIAQLYESRLEKEAMYNVGTEENPIQRLPYYTKVDESAHIVDWDKYIKDDNYKYNIVLKSNKLDAKAVYDLGYIIQEEFKKAFNWYPNTLVSSGSLARSSVVAVIHNKYKELYPDNPDKVKRLTLQDIKSIGIENYKNKIVKEYGGDFYKDFHCICTEAYSGGYIESLKYGYCKSGYYADIASAYPAVIKELYDLRNCKITKGYGIPPHIKNSYCIIRGVVDIPLNVNYHPLTIKDTVNKDTNIRAVGVYRASYTLEERDFLIECGANFKEEEWYNIETEGKLSPLAEVEQHLLDLRAYFRSINNSAQYIAKKTANSGYGILFEAVDTFEEILVTKEEKIKIYNEYRDIIKEYKGKINLNSIKKDLKYYYDDKYYNILSQWHNKDGITLDSALQELEDLGIQFNSFIDVDRFIELEKMYNYKLYSTEIYDSMEVLRAGYRAGEFFNPLYATIITSRTRILISKSCKAIKEAGGEPILVMTDSVFWKGTSDMLPVDLWKFPKTVGYFEKPEKVTDIVCLGSGRYCYTDPKKGTVISKRRGLNITDVHDPKGALIGAFNWRNALEIARQQKSIKIIVKVRALISVGVVLHNSNYDIKDLGRVVEQIRKVDLIVGKSKRFFEEGIKNPDILSKQLVDTKPKFLGYGMLGENDYNDQTLPKLRALLKDKEVLTQSQKNKRSQRKATKKWDSNNKEKRNKVYNHKYKQIKEYGYNSYEANKMARWSIERITEKLKEDGRL